MRHWKIHPRYLCRKHLLGMHVETHMLQGTLDKKIKVNGYLEKGLIEVHNNSFYHDEVVKEMKKRGYTNHKTPISEKYNLDVRGDINVNTCCKDLWLRCPDCRERIGIFSDAIVETEEWLR